VKAFAVWMRGMPMLARWVTVAALFAGVAGGIVGLVVGLFAYAPTAPFAAVELGFPATFVGGVVGLVVGMIMTTALRIRRHAVSSRIKHIQAHQRR
jgi:hypothetical protein